MSDDLLAKLVKMIAYERPEVVADYLGISLEVTRRDAEAQRTLEIVQWLRTSDDHERQEVADQIEGRFGA